MLKAMPAEQAKVKFGVVLPARMSVTGPISIELDAGV